MAKRVPSSLSAHRISAGWRIDEAVECTVIRMCPGRCGGRGADLHRVCLLAAHLPKPTWAGTRQF